LAHYIVTQIADRASGGIIVEGVFATMMGVDSAAVNALATSFTKDFFMHSLRGQGPGISYLGGRLATFVFGGLRIWWRRRRHKRVDDSKVWTIRPIALGHIGYTYGARVGVFCRLLIRREAMTGPNIYWPVWYR